MASIRLMVVEDEDFTRTTLVAALRLHGLDVIADSASVQGAVELAKALKPAVALIDLNLGPGPTGLDLANHLRKMNPDIGLVILTSVEDPRLLRSATPELPAGTQWLVKRSVSDVAVVGIAISNSIDEIKGGQSQVTQSPAMRKLSAVQIETLRLVGAGFTNAEIARKRFVSERSVEQTISRLSKTFNLDDQPAFNQRATLVKVFYRYSNAK